MDHRLFHMDTPEQTSRQVAEAVKSALRAADVTYRDAAEATGIPLTTLNRRLNAGSPFLVTELASLASVTGTTVSELFSSAARQSDTHFSGATP